MKHRDFAGKWKCEMFAKFKDTLVRQYLMRLPSRQFLFSLVPPSSCFIRSVRFGPTS
jgi:hypothetical protein